MAHQAITTKYLAATDRRGSRIKATARAGTVIVPYDSGLSSTRNHAEAAKALAVKLKWPGAWLAGGLPGGMGNVFVLLPESMNAEHHPTVIKDGFVVSL